MAEKVFRELLTLADETERVARTELAESEELLAVAIDAGAFDAVARLLVKRSIAQEELRTMSEIRSAVKEYREMSGEKL